jgi:mRNA interferase MazF
MAGVLRGDIWWADLNPTISSEQAGVGPVLVISHGVFNERSQTAIILAITGKPQRAGFPLTCEITSSRLPRQSWVKISQIRTISVQRLRERIDHILPEEMDRIIEGLYEIIG